MNHLQHYEAEHWLHITTAYNHQVVIGQTKDELNYSISHIAEQDSTHLH